MPDRCCVPRCKGNCDNDPKACKLSLKALNPSPFERQNVNLALRIFNDFVAQALVELGSKHNILHWPDTSVYIKIISTWRDVVNVKTPMKGLHEKILTSSH